MAALAASLESDRKRKQLLGALGELQGDSASVPWPESLHDRVIRLRLAITDKFDAAMTERALSSPEGTDLGVSVPTTGSPVPPSSLRLIQADVLRLVQQLADDLPRTLYQDSVQASMRREYQENSVSLTHLQQQVFHQQQQLFNARRLNATQALGSSSDALPPVDDGSTSGFTSPLRMGGSRGTSPQLGPASSLMHRPASAGGVHPSSSSSAFQSTAETFSESQLRILYSHIHEARSALNEEKVKVAALKAFCIRKDGAMEYIKETLLREVVLLKEQLRRQEHDPSFISDFVTLFDCWKVLEGDDPSHSGGGDGGSSEAVRIAKKELQAEATRVQQQLQLALRKKDDEISELNAKLAAGASQLSEKDRKKSMSGKRGDSFQDQFLQLTADMAKKDVTIGELTEEVKQLQTEVAIAQQMAKSTRDQLNRSNLDVEQAVQVREREILAKTECLAAMEAEVQRLKQQVSDDEVRKRQAEIIQAQEAIASLTSKCLDVEERYRTLEEEHRRLDAVIRAKDEAIRILQDDAKQSVDERREALDKKIKDLEHISQNKDVLLGRAEQRIAKLEAELDNTSSRLETLRFEHTKLRSATRIASGQPSPQTDQGLMPPVDETRVPIPTADLAMMVEVNNAAATTPVTPNIDPGTTSSAEPSGAARVLERRLAKEMTTANQLRSENAALKEELVRTTEALAVVDSPRRRVARRSQQDDAVDTTAQLIEKDRQIDSLLIELESLRKGQIAPALESLLQRPAATYAFANNPRVLQSTIAAAQRSPLTTSGAEAERTVTPTVAMEAILVPRQQSLQDKNATTTVKAAHSKSSKSSGSKPAVSPSQQRSAMSQPQNFEYRSNQERHQTAAREIPKRRHAPDAVSKRPVDADVSPFENSLDAEPLMTPIQTSKGMLSFHEEPDDSNEDMLSPAVSADGRGIPVGSTSPGYPGAIPLTPNTDVVYQRVRVLETSLVEKEMQLHQAQREAAEVQDRLHQQAAATQAEHDRQSRIISSLNAHIAYLEQQQQITTGSSPEGGAATVETVDEATATATTSRDPLIDETTSTADGLATTEADVGDMMSVVDEGCDAPDSIKRVDESVGPSATHEASDATQTVEVYSEGSKTSLSTKIAVTTSAKKHTPRSQQNAAAQTDITLLYMAELTSSRLSRPLTASSQVSRQGSAGPSHRGGGNLPAPGTANDHGTSGDEAAAVDITVPAMSTHRVFSAHRRAVPHATVALSSQQKVTRVAEPSFYMTGDGEVIESSPSQEVGGSIQQSAVTGVLPAGKLVKRPTGSASSAQRGMVDKLSNAVAVAKGLSDATKARSAQGASRPSTAQRSAHAEEDGESRLLSDGDEDGGHEGNATIASTRLVTAASSGNVGRHGPFTSSGVTGKSMLSLVDRPQAPAVLTGAPELPNMAKDQLLQPRARLSPAPMLVGGSTYEGGIAARPLSPITVEPHDVSSFTALPPPHQQQMPPADQRHSSALPTTVDHREHMSQVVFGGNNEQSAIRGVKEKIKQNMNVEKFIGRVLQRRQ